MQELFKETLNKYEGMKCGDCVDTEARGNRDRERGVGKILQQYKSKMFEDERGSKSLHR